MKDTEIAKTNKIGIIDDNLDQRVTLRLSLEVYLEDNDSTFEVIDIFPFVTETFEEYFKWINDENIVCLIFDERMNNETENGVTLNTVTVSRFLQPPSKSLVT